MNIIKEIGNKIRSEVWSHAENKSLDKECVLGFNPIPWGLFRLGNWMYDTIAEEQER